MQLTKGAKVERNRIGNLTQPTQFLSRKEKDPEWCAWNMDWFEWQGLKQLRRNSRRLLKNYKLSKGIIDKTDYIIEEDNEYLDLVELLTKEDESALELKFYPIIPNVINILTSEFSKRNTKITYNAVDPYSQNELLEQKYEMVSQRLIAEAQQKLMAKMIEAGADLEGEEAQKALSVENLKTLPEIESFTRKNYRNIAEIWARHQHQVDEERFKMNELEDTAFRDMLTTDRQFWHFRMGDDDYELELWNPVLTFYHKSPNARYISQGNYVGKVDMMSPADVIDVHGWKMTEEQLKSLEDVYPVKAMGYVIEGLQNDGSFYDATKSHEWNMPQPSLAMRQFNTMRDLTGAGDIVSWILDESEDFLDFGNQGLLRVTTIYWKTQRRVGHLTKIDDLGEVKEMVVDETYKVTVKPMYDTVLFKEKSKNNLLYGEHIDWIWINQVYGGVKIGAHHPGALGQNATDPEPIYLGINQNQIGPVKFQFKGDHSLYGCKLPVEGAVFSDRNTKSTCLVDQMKPFQIGYNIVNNQIADILVDELGSIILFDQNALPRHSNGEDWGKNNLGKAYVAMKNFQMLPLDTSLQNLEGATNFNQFTVLNMEQTARLKSRVELANYFKTAAFESIGITPQRLGQQLTQDTATGIEQALNASYAQTEMYFIQHSDYLMPRVHQMRTDLAQYYHSTKPSIQLQYMSSADEKMFFKLSGTELLLRDIHVYASTKANHRAILEQMKNMLLTNNTTGASIYDLGQVLQNESLAELNHSLKAIEEKANKIRQQEMSAESDAQKAELESKAALEREKMEFEAAEAEKDRQKDIIVAEIRASGYGAMQDIDQNQQSDFQDHMETIRKSDEFQQTMGLNREKEQMKVNMHRDKLNLEREKLNLTRENKDKDLMIARENQTRAEIEAAKDRKIKKSGKK